MKWKPRKEDWAFIVAVVAIVGFVSVLPTPRERNPPVPANAEHRVLAAEKQCSQCHAPHATRPLPVRHPKRQDCFTCHRRAGVS